jgi:hypothetical protein
VSLVSFVSCPNPCASTEGFSEKKGLSPTHIPHVTHGSTTSVRAAPARKNG